MKRQYSIIIGDTVWLLIKSALNLQICINAYELFILNYKVLHTRWMDL